jgi:REP element-mobilizing transposase RayT
MRPNEGQLPDPLAYFVTWNTYGTWLPGDQRGWVEYRQGWQLPDPLLELEAAARMTEDACRLDPEQRKRVEAQVEETCQFRGWVLRAVNCRTNHVHVVVTADRKPEVVRNQLKAWCTRRLKELDEVRRKDRPDLAFRENWWAERGSQRYVNDEDSLEAAILYVRDGQDRPR